MWVVIPAARICIGGGPFFASPSEIETEAVLKKFALSPTIRKENLFDGKVIAVWKEGVGLPVPREIDFSRHYFRPVLS
jgi:hypothetical protein